MSAAIRSALAGSVEKVLSILSTAGLSFAGDFTRWRRALEENPRPSPRLWAVYHDLVQATLAERTEQAADLATDLLGRDAGHVQAAGTVATLTPRHLGADVARCIALLDHDASHPLGLHAVDEAEVERVARLLASARELLARGAPELLDEVDVLGHQLLLGKGEQTVFGGAATVFLWGAVVLNPRLIKDRIDLAESLAHETAHALLFGLTLGEDLTLNDPGERFSSPLRADPRPIEGIVHATYVLARMVYALRSLSRLTVLDAAERRRVADKIERNTASYHAGLGVVQAHARFTPAGAVIFENCRRAMADPVG